MQPIKIEGAGLSNQPSSDGVLYDACMEGDSQDKWVIPAGELKERGELILHLGCSQHIKFVQLKNLDGELGGTDKFSIFISEFSAGPWDLILEGMMNQTAGSECSEHEMYTFDIESRSDPVKMHYDKLHLSFRKKKMVAKFLKFQINTVFDPNGGLNYIGVFGRSVQGFASKIKCIQQAFSINSCF